MTDMARRLIQHPNRASDGSLSYCTRITAVADIFAGHIWEATGYGYTLVDSEYNVTCINHCQMVL